MIKIYPRHEVPHYNEALGDRLLGRDGCDDIQWVAEATDRDEAEHLPRTLRGRLCTRTAPRGSAVGKETN